MELEGLEIAELKMTGPRSPSQWEGSLHDNRSIYIRYRWGCLTVNVSGAGGDVGDAIDLDPVFEKQIGHDLDGSITFLEVTKLTGLIGPKEVKYGI